jgi:hypothetical protein
MHPENAFLHAIKDDPGDDVIRLVFEPLFREALAHSIELPLLARITVQGVSGQRVLPGKFGPVLLEE